MGRVFGGAKPAPAPTVTPNPVVTPKAAVQIGDNIDGEKKKATVKRGVPRRLSSSVLGSVAGETTKSKLGD